MSTEQIEALLVEIPLEIARRQQAEKQAAQARIQEIAQRYGMTVDELLGKGSHQTSSRTGSIKSKSPRSNLSKVAKPIPDPIEESQAPSPQEPWKGRNDRPNWLKAVGLKK